MGCFNCHTYTVALPSSIPTLPASILMHRTCILVLLRRTFSFHAFSYNAYFHSPPSPTYGAYFHFPRSPIALIFISHILLVRIFSLCKYRRGIILYIEYQSVCPFVWIGPPHPLHCKRKWLHPWPLGPKWGGHIRFRGREWGVPIPTKGQNLRYSMYTKIPLR